jgi:cell division protein FtsN
MPQYQPRLNNSDIETIETALEENLSAEELENSAENVSDIIQEEAATAIFENKAIPSEANNVPANESHQFFIIGGCFSIAENAELFVKELNAKGHQAKLVDHNKGLYRVSFGSYASRDEANNALMNLKSENKGAWILKK